MLRHFLHATQKINAGTLLLADAHDLQQDATDLIAHYFSTGNIGVNPWKTQLIAFYRPLEIPEAGDKRPHPESEARNRADIQYGDALDSYMNEPFTLFGETIKQTDEVHWLGVDLDRALTLIPFRDAKIKRMKQLAGQVFDLARRHKVINTASTKLLANSLMQNHVNYCDAVLIALCDDIEPMRSAYNRTIHETSGELWHVPTDVIAIFEGHKTFNQLSHYLCCRSFIKLLRIHSRISMSEIIPLYFTQITRWYPRVSSFILNEKRRNGPRTGETKK